MRVLVVPNGTLVKTMIFISPKMLFNLRIYDSIFFANYNIFFVHERAGIIRQGRRIGLRFLAAPRREAPLRRAVMP
jgi:hypothetical protein